MTDDTTPIAHWYEQYVMPTYLRVGLTIARGRGSSLWDTAGRRYLDFFPGVDTF